MEVGLTGQNRWFSGKRSRSPRTRYPGRQQPLSRPRAEGVYGRWLSRQGAGARLRATPQLNRATRAVVRPRGLPKSQEVSCSCCPRFILDPVLVCLQYTQSPFRNNALIFQFAVTEPASNATN